MKCRIVVLLGIVLFVPSVIIAAEPKPVSEGLKIELQALKARMKLKSGEVRLHWVRDIAPRHIMEGSSTDLSFLIEFDGFKRRAERTLNQWQVTQRRIFTGTDYIYDEGRKERMPRILSRKLVEKPPYPRSPRDDLFHPRILGVYPLDLTTLDNCSIEQVLGNTDRNGETVVSELLDGHPVKHISYRRSVGSLVDLWIAPKMDYAVLKVQASGKTTRQMVHSHYKKPNGGIWFPHKIVYHKFVKDRNRLTKQGTIVIKSAKFNIGIDPQRFTLASLDLKPGEKVNKDGRDMVWDGEKLIGLNEAAKRTFTDPTPRTGSWWKPLWITLAVFLAALAFWILKKRGAQQTPA